MIAGKIWGTTELIENNQSLEFHRIEFKANHCCSEHYHATKWNGFFVEEGTMMIKTWTDDTVDVTYLHAGDYYKVPPGKWHQFIGINEGIAFELYWAEFDATDIVRRTHGFKMEESPDERHVGNPLADLNAS